MAKFAQGKYTIKNPNKYVGKGQPTYRSSWEYKFMEFCDNTESVLKWASEAIQIPYRNPFTNKNTVYVPDFFIVYEDKDKKRHAELIEIKPRNQTLMESAKSNKEKAQVILNAHKWNAAKSYCAANGLVFRVINEQHIFQGTRQ
jgi:hypothetical protein